MRELIVIRSVTICGAGRDGSGAIRGIHFDAERVRGGTHALVEGLPLADEDGVALDEVRVQRLGDSENDISVRASSVSDAVTEAVQIWGQ